MSRIRILSENLANQIAAGEVVERPASVVKELVENAVDAGASRVEVWVEGNGTRLIRVLDDGCGMDADDVLLSLERHATSKLASQEDLAAILTLGFRGEALPAIASVARLTITSRLAGADLGMRAEIRFGRLEVAHEMGCPQGTAMEVQDLFGNVPARRKFLKSAATELAHIEEVVKACGLARPALGLRFMVNGREALNLPGGCDSLEKRVRRLVAPGEAGPLVAVQATAGNMEVQGFLLPPDSGQAGSARLRLLVNGRPVRDRMMTHGVSEGLTGFLLKGHRPAGVLFLSLPPDAVDVNVHPTKQEVRFRKSSEIHDLVVRAVRDGMASHQDEVRHAVFGVPVGQATLPRTSLTSQASPTGQTGPTELPLASAAAEPERPYVAQAQTLPLAPAPASAPAAALPGFRLIGQLHNAYILCETADGLVAIDQHALQERILFETLKEQYRGPGIASQVLLFPKMLEPDPAARAVLENHADDLARLGLTMEPFGGDSYVVKAVPAIMGHLEPGEIVQGILVRFSEALAEAGGRAATRMEDILASMDCKAAIKAGHRLHEEEMVHLIAKLNQSPIFSHCPHGRPVLKHFDLATIQRWFHRT
ncbi:MAG: DNA mismatch repair protein MutL [Deltaproteobacteria bacterium CG23_combo_of_CG06-09_8_20_14_all_60_8]|nr:MAG: DNA mismatch repair protein MutL [Deltaproteobacteria bacterium CG23_combo_of_CG06-09_8_20_14_all_60_8]